MLPIMLIIVGSVFIGLGGIGLLVLLIHPFYSAIRELLIQRKSSLQINDFDKKSAASESAYKVLKKSIPLFLFIGFVCLASGLWLKYAPRGNDSLFSENIEGEATGNDGMEYQQNQGNDTTVNYVTSDGKSYSYYIVVSEKTIYYNGHEIGGTEEFEEYLKKLDRNNLILLVDDFAVSPTYHKVAELLDTYGMNYKTESDE